MNYVRNSVLATIAYYDTLDYPLTPMEIWKFLVNPGRVHVVREGLGDIGFNEILGELETLRKLTVITEKNGFYFMNRREDLYTERIRREKTAAQKWVRFLKYCRFLVLAPYLRAIFAGGSMALYNTTPQSDWDVLVIAKSGRLYTARLFLWLISSALGVRRKPGEAIAPNKLCFNHYLVDRSLGLAHESMYNAQSYANLKPVYVPDDIFYAFFQSNIWIHNYIYNFQPSKNFVRRSITPNRFFLFIARIGEKILSTALGDWIEEKLKEYQQKRIQNNPATYKPGGRIVFTDWELEFHPSSFEKVVIEKYKENLRRLGVVLYVEEKDSGLSV